MTQEIFVETKDEREPRPELLLEVGTIDIYGYSAPGFNPAEVSEGSTIFTVDLPKKFTSFQDEWISPVKAQSLKDSYGEQRDYQIQNGEIVPNFNHIPLFADGRLLPFPDDTFDKVLFNDVIGDPSLKSVNTESLITEALRVIKVEGEIWVVDDRASGDNLAAFEHIFPESEAGSGFTRTDDLRFWAYDGIHRRNSKDEIEDRKRNYEALSRRVNSYDPDFYVIKKTREWKSRQSVVMQEAPHLASGTSVEQDKATRFTKLLRRLSR